MEITTYLGDLRFLETDLILAGMYEDELPPQGLAGRIDWYLFGQLTDLILSGKFNGKIGRFALLASQGKITAPKFVVVGLGEKKNMAPAVLQDLFPQIVGSVRGLLVRSSAVELVGAGVPGISPGEAARRMIDVLAANEGKPAAERIIIIPADETQQETVEKLLR